MTQFDNRQQPTIWAQRYTRTQHALGISPLQYDAYRRAVGQIESGCNPNMGAGGAGRHYWGMYQFGSAATDTTNRLLGERISRQQFCGNQDLAERHFDALSYSNHQTLMRISARYRGMSPEQRLSVLGYAHNQGAGGAAQWLATGRPGHDGFGTSGTRYSNAILDALRGIGRFIGNIVTGIANGIGTAFNAIGNFFSNMFRRQPDQQPPQPMHHPAPYMPDEAPQHGMPMVQHHYEPYPSARRDMMIQPASWRVDAPAQRVHQHGPWTVNRHDAPRVTAPNPFTRLFQREPQPHA